MKRPNYYQVHKNKKPKIKYEKRIMLSAKYFIKMSKKSIRFRDSLISFKDSMDDFYEKIKMVTVHKPASCGPTEILTPKKHQK